MITKSQARRKQDIKTKLMAAIAMLLVSSIMMVSSTYAWFTLSTAPEVTGITTAVGANGNLEMALLPKTGGVAAITSEAGDSTKAIEAKNVTWGNLVDLADTSIYGLDKITLFPSALNVLDGQYDENGNPLKVETSMLKTPTYGADGRVSELAANTVTGYYDSQTNSFAPNDYYGVRAVGTASGMTDRQLDYRNARSAANTAAAAAKNKASQSLNTNGSALANIAIEYGMGADTASFDSSDVAALRKIINDLKGTDGVFKQIETAYMQYILAYAASAATGTEDTVWQAVSGVVETDGATLDSVIAAIGKDKIPTALQTAIGEYSNGTDGMVENVAEADTALQALEAKLATDAAATFTWSEISAAMTPLANPSAMVINGFAANEVKENLGELVSSVTAQGGLKVVMNTGAGVYADIADQCGDYTASITIESVEYNGIVLNNMTARMETKTTVNPQYLSAVSTAVEAALAPESGAVGSMPITDMYGYVIDLAFRTNAAESKLLLQVDATDRIYGSGNTNEETMGGGSSMTFASTTTDFSNDQVKDLMEAIRIVFFDPTNNNAVVATAKLDVDNATVGADGITAEMYLYTISGGGETSYTPATYDGSATGVTYYTKGTEEIYTKITNLDGFSGTRYVEQDGSYVEWDGNTTYETYYEKTTQDKYEAVDATTAAGAAAGTLYVQTTTTAGENKIADNAIMSLNQNQAHALSVLVYLDGNNVGNDDVAATAATSMTGSMNLQFASSANLVPMDYAALNIPAQGSSTTGGTTTTTETTGTDAGTETPADETTGN